MAVMFACVHYNHGTNIDKILNGALQISNIKFEI